MDHNWGRNVYKYGLVGTGATLAARYLPVTWEEHVVANIAGAPGWYILWVLPNPVFPNQSYSGYIGYQPSPFPHFPGCEPDYPV